MMKILLYGQRGYLNMTSNLKIIVVNGRPTCGKTTFEKFCKELMGSYCETISTIDVIKDIALHGGWHGEKTPKARKLLSELKRVFTEYNNLTFMTVENFIKNWESELMDYNVASHPHILLVDVREPEEIQKFKDKLNAITVLIRRPDVENEATSNYSDNSVFEYRYDYELWNTGSLENLKEIAKNFINLIFDKNVV